MSDNMAKYVQSRSSSYEFKKKKAIEMQTSLENNIKTEKILVVFCSI